MSKEDDWVQISSPTTNLICRKSAILWFCVEKDSHYYYHLRIMTSSGVKSLEFKTKDAITPVVDKLYEDLIHIKTE